MKLYIWILALLAAPITPVFGAGRQKIGGASVPRFYYDLGPSQIDVSAYPKVQQENYKVFAQTCSQCHTLARPINSPMISRRDWSRYIGRMTVNSKNAPVKPITKSERDSILSFLVYDAKIRKVDYRAKFTAQTASLKKQFAQFKKARLRQEQKKNANRQSRSYFYSGPSPRPY